MGDRDLLAARFERERSHLRSVAYRMLGSVAEADDAVQETWLRFVESSPHAVVDLRGWLTRIVTRLALNRLRTRRRESHEVLVPDPLVRPLDRPASEEDAITSESVGLALLVVLDRLSPAERVAFVLHDLFSIPFDEIATWLDRTPAATRKLASRARVRVRARARRPDPDSDPERQRQVVAAFFAAARAGDLDGLVRVLAPDAVLRVDAGGGRSGPSRVFRGARTIARRAAGFGRLSLRRAPAIVNGAAGVVVFSGDHPFSVMGFTVVGSRIVAIDVLSDPVRLARLDLQAFGGRAGPS